MQTLNHPYLNGNGSLDHAAASDGARDARSEALRAMFRGLMRRLHAAGQRLPDSAQRPAHAA